MMKMVAMLRPQPSEQSGIASYAAYLCQYLADSDIQIQFPLIPSAQPIRSKAEAQRWVADQNWQGIDIVHAELGGGRISEFFILQALQRQQAHLRLSATVHDPARLVWRPVNVVWQTLHASGILPASLEKGLALLSDHHTLSAERHLAQHLSGMVTLTHMGAQALAQKMKVAEANVHAIPHGTLPMETTPLPPLQPVKVIYFGYIYPGKGIEDLIDAVAMLKQHQPNVVDQLQVTLSGGSTPELAYKQGQNHIACLQHKIDAAQVGAHFQWQLDLDEAHIASLIQAHHVVVLPYKESAKLSLLGEMRSTSGVFAWAMACGRGVIASDARAFKEELSHGNGRIYEQGNVSALSDALGSILREPDQIRPWSLAAKQVGMSRRWDVTARHYCNYFHALK